jgi:hypothetical protein
MIMMAQQSIDPGFLNQGTNTETAGGTRFSEGKPNPMWTPALGLLEVARVTSYGSQKYAPHDWMQGQSYSTLINSAARHFLSMLVHGPLSCDSESGLLHAAHCAWNLLALLTFHTLGRDEELDDLSKWIGVTTGEKKVTALTYAERFIGGHGMGES